MIRKLAVAFSLLTLVLACDEQAFQSGSSKTLPDSNGGILDVMVIAPEVQWQGIAGDEFRKHFQTMQYGLPQPVPRFTVRQVEPADYKELLKRSRYQVIFNKNEKAGISYVKEEHAKNQLIIYLSGPDGKSIAKVIAARQEEMRERIKSMERARLLKRLQPAMRPEISETYKKHNVSLVLPRDFELDVEKEDLLIYWKKTQLSDQGIMVHFRPYPENEAILGQEIIPIRDSLTQEYILGERPGSYMITEDLVKPQITALDLQENFAMEARGLWRTENDIMGGPFISYTIYDEKNKQVIYLDAFIYAPEKKKRNMIFELEALLRSIEIN